PPLAAGTPPPRTRHPRPAPEHRSAVPPRRPHPRLTMARPPRVYLAGPEVFLADPSAIGDRKRAICARHGLLGIFPGAAEPPRAPALAPQLFALAISQAMEAAMRSCDAMIVNLTPFRGVSADVGSAYEMGFMRGLGRPVFGYTHDPRCYRDRV